MIKNQLYFINEEETRMKNEEWRYINIFIYIFVGLPSIDIPTYNQPIFPGFYINALHPSFSPLPPSFIILNIVTWFFHFSNLILSSLIILRLFLW